MTVVSSTKESTISLVYQVKDGNNDAFLELERVAKPLLSSIASQFSKYHPRFEYQDFYQIALLAMYSACIKYDKANPSFLSYARAFMVNNCLKEVEHWSQAKRNVFSNSEVDIENAMGFEIEDDLFENTFKGQFREHVERIISQNFDGNKAIILRMHILDDKKVCDIADELGLKYKNVYSVIQRGTEEIKQKYSDMYLDKTWEV